MGEIFSRRDPGGSHSVPWRSAFGGTLVASSKIVIDCPAGGAVRLTKGYGKLFQQPDDGLAFFEPYRGPCGDLVELKGAILRPVTGPQAEEITRPPHDYGHNCEEGVNQ